MGTYSKWPLYIGDRYTQVDIIWIVLWGPILSGRYI